MLSQKLLDALNEQMNFEFESAHTYLAMAGFFAELGLDGFTNFFQVQYEEEIFHAKKFMTYIADKGGRVMITGFDNPENEFNSIIDAFEKALAHEQEVTSRVYNLVDIAREEREHATASFLQFFVDEQVEEEASFESLISKIKLLDGVGTYLLDQELSKRVFVAPNTKA